MKKTILLSLAAVAIVTGILMYNFWHRYFLFDADYDKGLALIKEELKKQPGHQKSYKYTYYNFWDLNCKPCIEEMPELDSLADRLSSNIRFVFVSNNKQENVDRFLKKKQFQFKHFVFVNDMNYFISAVYKKVNKTYNVVPTQVITDSLGNILLFKQGGMSKLYIDDMKISDEDKKRFKETLKDPVIKKLESLD